MSCFDDNWKSTVTFYLNLKKWQRWYQKVEEGSGYKLAKYDMVFG